MVDLSNFDMDSINGNVVSAIKKFLAENNLPESFLHRRLGLTQMTAYRQLNGQSNVSLETLCKLRTAFPNFSIDNALTGDANADVANTLNIEQRQEATNERSLGISNEKFIQEMAEQRKLLTTAQNQITSLLAIISKMQGTDKPCENREL